MKDHDFVELVGVMLLVLGVLTCAGAASFVHTALAVLVVGLGLIFAAVVVIRVALAAERSKDPR